MTDVIALALKKKTILFDMDGTIVNTEILHARAAVLVLKELNIDINLESCLEKYYGMTDTAVLKLECPQLNDEEVNKAIDSKNKKLIELFKQLTENEKQKYITPGFPFFLETLIKNNIQVGVVSASEDIIVKETLICFNFSHLIPLQMGRNQTVKTKPHPDPYLEAMKRLNSSPHETLIFEDSPTGLKAASDSKAQVIRITGFAHDNIKSEFLEIENFLTRS